MIGVCYSYRTLSQEYLSKAMNQLQMRSKDKELEIRNRVDLGERVEYVRG